VQVAVLLAIAAAAAIAAIPMLAGI